MLNLVRVVTQNADVLLNSSRQRYPLQNYIDWNMPGFIPVPIILSPWHRRNSNGVIIGSALPIRDQLAVISESAW